MQRPSSLRSGASALAASLVAALGVAAAGAARPSLPSDRRDELQHRLGEKRGLIEAAKARERRLGAQIASETDRIDRVEGRIGTLGSELAALQSRLSVARSRLDQFEDQLAEQREQLVLLRRQLTIAERRLAERAVEIYTSDEPDPLALVLGARSLREALDQLDLYERISEQDSRIINAVERTRSAVIRLRERTAELRERQAAATAELARRTQAHEAVQGSLFTERSRLESLRADRRRALDSITVQREQWEAEADAIEAESARLTELLAAAPRVQVVPPLGSASTGDQHFPTPSDSAPSSSGLIWPLRGTVVSPFGMRWGRLHAGLDIAAPAGAPIVAAAAGTVVYAGWMGGYGLLVVLQHANGLATAYAHNSSIGVSPGDSVSQGQTIAAVGCTGYCFGNHVHFEVRVGGNAVDPMGYL